MEIMRCCPWFTGSIEDFLDTSPCPPPMMNVSDFQTFVLDDQNISKSEYNIIARKCNVLNMGTTTTEITFRSGTTETSTIKRTSNIPSTADTTCVNISDTTLNVVPTTISGLTTSHMNPVVTDTAPTNSSYEGLVIGVVCGALAIILILLLVWIIRKKARTARQSQNDKTTINVQVCVSMNSHQRSNSTGGSKSFESITKERISENETVLETLTNNKSSELVIFQNERKKENNDMTPKNRNIDDHIIETFGNKLEHTYDIVTSENSAIHEHDSVAADEHVNKSVTVDNNTEHKVSYFEEKQRGTQTTYL